MRTNKKLGIKYFYVHTHASFYCYPHPHTRGAGREEDIAHVLGVHGDRIKLGRGADEKVGPREVGLIGAQTNGGVQRVALAGQHNLMGVAGHREISGMDRGGEA